MYKWPDIAGFHNILRGIELQKYTFTTYYRAKIKLHGTNAGVLLKADGRILAQSRTSIINTQRDNAGFAAWVEGNDYFKQLSFEDDTVIYGEWCGPGIQKGTAINKIPNKILAVFGIRKIWENQDILITDPEHIHSILGTNIPSDIRVLPWYTPAIEINFDKPEEVLKYINNLVNIVEREDPWVSETFNITGIGEGLVFYPLGKTLTTEIGRLMFKAKGEKHRTVNQKQPAQTSPEMAENIEQFISLILTEARLRQGLTEGAGDIAEPRMIGLFLEWINRDVRKECGEELEASNLTWKQVGKQLSSTAKQWFLQTASRKV